MQRLDNWHHNRDEPLVPSDRDTLWTASATTPPSRMRMQTLSSAWLDSAKMHTVSAIREVGSGVLFHPTRPRTSLAQVKPRIPAYSLVLTDCDSACASRWTDLSSYRTSPRSPCIRRVQSVLVSSRDTGHRLPRGHPKHDACFQVRCAVLCICR